MTENVVKHLQNAEWPVAAKLWVVDSMVVVEFGTKRIYCCVGDWFDPEGFSFTRSLSLDWLRRVISALDQSPELVTAARAHRRAEESEKLDPLHEEWRARRREQCEKW